MQRRLLSKLPVQWTSVQDIFFERRDQKSCGEQPRDLVYSKLLKPPEDHPKVQAPRPSFRPPEAFDHERKR